MGYRYPDHVEHKRHLDLVAPKMDLNITNGQNTYVKLPLFYMVRNNDHEIQEHMDHHNHRGWPRPGHPDDSCQILIGHDGCRPGWHLEPIKLAEEGYNFVHISGPDSSPLGAFGEISGEPGEENVIILSAWSSTVEEEKQDTVMTVSLCILDEENAVLVQEDVVCVYDVHILPAPYEELTWPDPPEIL